MKNIKYVVYSTDKNDLSSDIIGGKALGLHELQQIDCNIPKWATITTGFFNNVKNKHPLLTKLIKNKDDDGIRNYIDSISFNNDEQDILKTVWDKISNNEKTSIAVRSSASDEDNQKHSFAGQMDSFLHIKSFNDYLIAIRKCWSSIFSKRAISYRTKNNLDIWNVQIAVIVQQMILSDTSGIIFTANPITNNLNEMLITSGYGLGEGLVSGILDADTYVLNENGQVLKKQLIKKQKKLIPDKNGGTFLKETTINEQDKSSLSLKQLDIIHKLAKQAEKIKKVPLDIEFSIHNDKIYLLQARPITSLKKKEKINIWDNSNIVESYSGVTTPLTFSFIKKAYYAVYHQFCETIGINNKAIFKNRWILKNMLGLISGRVYYNLLNWYKLVSLMPGFKYNKSFMEQMMGLQIIKDPEIQNISISKSNKYFIQLPKLIKVGIKMISAHFKLPKQINTFFSNFNKTYDYYSNLDYSTKTPYEIMSIYRILEDEILWKWKSPITNDFESMIFYGILKKLTISWGIDSTGSLHNDLLRGKGNIISTDLINSLTQIAEAINKNVDLKNNFLNKSPEEALFVLKNDKNYCDINTKFSSYLKNYGVRCINEMKLESIPIKDDPVFCISMIQNYLRNNIGNIKPHKKEEKNAIKKAENHINKKLNPIKRTIYKWVLNNCKNSIKNRENQRFARSQAYNLVRTLIRSIGKQWEEKKIINNINDIFFLELDEIWSYIEGTSTCINVKDLIEIRKQEFDQYQLENPDDHIETEGEVYYNNLFKKDIDEQNSNIIKGLGCCSGIIKKEVKVVFSPDKNLILNNEIMVAKQTDPGWGILFPSISGLIIEKASMLSHSAIVAREMGIPAVIGVKNATKILSSGDIVELDGAKGTIRIIRKKS